MRPRLTGQTVAPPMLLRQIALEILGIVDEDVCMPTKLGECLELGGLGIRGMQFIRVRLLFLDV